MVFGFVEQHRALDFYIIINFVDHFGFLEGKKKRACTRIYCIVVINNFTSYTSRNTYDVLYRIPPSPSIRYAAVGYYLLGSSYPHTLLLSQRKMGMAD